MWGGERTAYERVPPGMQSLGLNSRFRRRMKQHCLLFPVPEFHAFLPPPADAGVASLGAGETGGIKTS